MKVILIKDAGAIYSGTVINDVTKITKKYYHGTWSSMFGTYSVKIPKDMAKIYS